MKAELKAGKRDLLRRGTGLTRREWVERLLASAGAGIMAPTLSTARPARNHPADPSAPHGPLPGPASGEWKLEFFDAHQNETVIALAERIVPGSTRAQVNRFLDTALAADSQENQQRFMNALNALEAEALRRFAKPFKRLSETEQDEILTAASTGQPAGPNGRSDGDWFAEGSRPPGETPSLTLRDYFDHLKTWISGAYYSSEVGMKELGWTGDHFFESFPGCTHPGGHA